MKKPTPSRSGDPSALRRLNLQSVLRILHAGGVHTISELAQQAHLSRPTTKQAVDDLLASGWVTVSNVERDPAFIGRPAQAFEFRPDAGYVLSADIGATKVLVFISDLDGTIIARTRRSISPEIGAEARLGELALAINDTLDAFGQPANLISHAVIATPGSVNQEGEVVWNRAIPEWHGQNPGEWIAERYPFRAETASDMPMAALAEHWQGAATHAKDVVYVHVGHRLGAAALIDGSPHYGFHGAATQIGLWRAIPWREQYSDLLRLSGPQAQSGAPAVFEAAGQGDEDARGRVTALADELVAGLIPMIITMDPEILVIGGGVSLAGEGIAGPVRDRIKAETPFPPTVVCSSLGDEAVALGALRTALNRTEERLFAELSPATGE